MSELFVHRLGRVEYEDGLNLQRLFGLARTQGLVPDVLLLQEHGPVLTLGRAAKKANVLFPEAVLARRGVELFETNRGGDVTYHGPGQVVGYPIFQLQNDRRDVRRYVRDLEEVLIRTLGRFGLVATRIPKWTGVWLGDPAQGTARKIAAIGVHIARWQTSHGFALNVNTNLSHFDLIVPCGIREAGVTSMERELGHPVPLSDVEDGLIAAFAEVFGQSPVSRSPNLRTVSVTVLREGPSGLEVLLLKRRDDQGGFWQTVTGTAEGEETPEETAVRELREETGLGLSVKPLAYRHAFPLGDEVPPRIVEETAFMAVARRDQEVTIDPAEHDELRWLSPDEALGLVPYAGLRNGIRKALELR